jgi:hypothetical protein
MSERTIDDDVSAAEAARARAVVRAAPKLPATVPTVQIVSQADRAAATTKPVVLAPTRAHPSRRHGAAGRSGGRSGGRSDGRSGGRSDGHEALDRPLAGSPSRRARRARRRRSSGRHPADIRLRARAVERAFHGRRRSEANAPGDSRAGTPRRARPAAPHRVRDARRQVADRPSTLGSLQRFAPRSRWGVGFDSRASARSDTLSGREKST